MMRQAGKSDEHSAERPGSTNRRGFLGLLGAGAMAAVVGTGRAAAASPSSEATMHTLGASVAEGVFQSGSPVEYVGVRWPAGAGSGRIRFADKAARLGAWQSIHAGCVGGRGDNGGTATEQTTLVHVGDAPRFELQLPPGGSAVAVNSAGRPRAAAVAELSSLVGCLYLDRAAWGADESLRFDKTGAERYPQTYWPVQTLTVHHTATANDDPDPAARMRAIYRYQTVDLGYGDFGYHFLVDETGRIYEGRYSGQDGIPGFDTQRRVVNAAHVGGFNAGNVGIVLLGNFVDREMTSAAQHSLICLLAGIAGHAGLDPLATITYVNPISGATRTLSAIPGHRDWAATECPGGILYAGLPAIRQRVAELLTAGAAPTLARPSLTVRGTRS